MKYIDDASIKFLNASYLILFHGNPHRREKKRRLIQCESLNLI